MIWPTFFERHFRIQSLVIIVAYALSIGAGLLVPHPYPFVTLVTPTGGLSLAAGLLYGYRILPALFIAAIIGYGTAGAPLLVCLLFGLKVIAGTAVAIALTRTLTRRFDYSLGRVRDVVILIFVSTTSNALIGAFDAFTLAATGLAPYTDIPLIALTGWTGAVFSSLVITPFLLVWFGAQPRPLTRYNIVEKILFISITIAVNGIFFWSSAGRWPSLLPFFYITTLPLLYAGMRFGPHGRMSALLMMAGGAITGTMAGYGPFSIENAAVNTYVSCDLFLGLLAVVFLVLSGITEENRHAEHELAERNRDLEQAIRKIRSTDQAKTDFLATLAHELRNPLAPLVSSVDALAVEAPTSQEVTTIRSSIHTITKLLDDLLDISRISRRKFRLTKEHINLCEIIARTAAGAKPLIEQRQHTLSMTLPADDLWIHADPIRIEQIIINLINNAVRYTDPGGVISIHCSRSSNSAVLSVQDTGKGIAEHMLERIFEPFQQVDEEAHVAGLGLGLSLVRTLTELHGGSVTAASPGPGRGSTFTVRFPLLTRAQLPLLSGRESSTTAPTPRSIVIVDDNEAAAKGLSMLLKRAGHTVRVAHDGRSALTLAQADRPDVMILDIGLPDMDGYELARRIREAVIDTTLVALSGYGTPEDKQKARDAGFRFHITKPVGIAELEKTLARITGGDIQSA